MKDVISTPKAASISAICKVKEEEHVSKNERSIEAKY